MHELPEHDQSIGKNQKLIDTEKYCKNVAFLYSNVKEAWAIVKYDASFYTYLCVWQQHLKIISIYVLYNAL